MKPLTFPIKLVHHCLNPPANYKQVDVHHPAANAKKNGMEDNKNNKTGVGKKKQDHSTVVNF